MDSRSQSSSIDLQLVSELTTQWTPILQHSTQVVLYNPTSHALTIRPALAPAVAPDRPHAPRRLSRCPYCSRPFDLDEDHASPPPTHAEKAHVLPGVSERAPNYFELLQIANETASRPATPPLLDDAEMTPQPRPGMAEGYFEAFFKEEARLGMGAGGSVFLCEVRTVPRLD
jgi:hypothetical protein